MIKKMREAIILAMLKEGLKSKQELEARMDMHKKITRSSLRNLRTSGLVQQYTIGGNEYYHITDTGKHVVDDVFGRKF